MTTEKIKAAIACQEARKYAEAESLYRAVLNAEPDHPTANHNLGILAVQVGRPAAGLVFLEKAMKAQPGNALYWASLAQCWYALGEWERATALLDRARESRIGHGRFDKLRIAMTGREGAGGRKVFCIGRNKTGTTSMGAALRSLGLAVGLQARGELLARDWARRDFTRLLALCRTADAFQDVPFSCDDTYQAVDRHFPGSKFILTVRDDPEQWYRSVVKYHTRIVNKGRLPTADDLKAFTYRYQGYLWEAARMVHGIDENNLYDKEIYISHYMNHNRQVVDYFTHRPDDLLVLNVAEAGAMEKLCEFLGVEHRGQQMPHLNKSGWAQYPP